MPTWLIDIILGIVEGVTEFLPISSTGHLLMVEPLLGTAKSQVYIVVIQSGAVLAVVGVFAERLKELFLGMRKEMGEAIPLIFKRRWKECARRLQEEWPSSAYVLKLGLAFVLTCIGGLALKLGGFELPESAAPVLITFLIGGLLILLVEYCLRGKTLNDQVTWTLAAAFAVGQLLAAIFPGLSRSGTTILMGMAMGLNRERATEFSFILGVPTLLAAGGLELFSALNAEGTAGEASTPAIQWDSLVLGFLVSMITAFIAVKWLLHYVRSHTFEIFGWYRFVVGIPMAYILFA